MVKAFSCHATIMLSCRVSNRPEPEDWPVSVPTTLVPQADTKHPTGTSPQSLNALKQSDLRRPPRLVWISL
jgi:hypothetical protein